MAARPKTLAEAYAAFTKASANHEAASGALEAAIDSKTYGAAATAWKECHNAVLALKEATNHVYAHLGELKPKKADKLKPGGKLDNAPEGKQVDRRADKKRDEKGGKKTDRKEKRRAAAEAEPTEAASDEPTGDDHDEP